MPDKQLLDFIQERQGAGAAKADIAKELIAAGWEVSKVNSAFDYLEEDDGMARTAMPAPHAEEAVVKEDGAAEPTAAPVQPAPAIEDDPGERTQRFVRTGAMAVVVLVIVAVNVDLLFIRQPVRQTYAQGVSAATSTAVATSTAR